MRNCAFLVGCGEYNSRDISDLEDIDKDIKKIKCALIENCDCSSSDVFEISDNRDAFSLPNGENLLRIISEKSIIYKNCHFNNVFFYYSGHGYISDEEQAFLVPKNATTYPIVYGGIAIRQIADILKRLYDADNYILILDMCLEIIQSKNISLGVKSIHSKNFPKGIIVFYSCFPREKSFIIPQQFREELGNGSIFTSAFEKAIRDRTCCSVREISDYIKKIIDEYNKIIGVRQHPFTSIQDVSLGDVLLKQRENEKVQPQDRNEHRTNNDTNYFSKDADDKELDSDLNVLSSEDIKLLQDANTINADLNDEARLEIMNFVKEIDASNQSAVITYGNGTISKIRDFNSTIADKFKRIADEHNKDKSLIKSFVEDAILIKNVNINREEYKGSFHFFKRAMSNPIDEETTKVIEGVFDSILKNIETCETLFSKEGLMYKVEEEKATAYIDELSMYIIAGNMYIKQNADTENNAFKARIRFLEEYLHTFYSKRDLLKNAYDMSTQKIYSCQQYYEEVQTIILYHNSYLRSISGNIDGFYDNLEKLVTIIDQIIKMIK